MDNNPPEEVGIVIDVAGMVDIFGDSLYQDFGSVVRELVQNGHDAIVADVATEGTGNLGLSGHRIDVVVDEYVGELVVSDNGTGMTRRELAEHLTNFARSAKRDLRRELEVDSPHSEFLEIIGEYGVGFLAAMAVSDSVELLTICADSTTATVWRYEAGQSRAALSSVDRADFESERRRHGLTSGRSGTIVICTLRNEIVEGYEVDSEDVRVSLSRYAALLPVPVFFNDIQISCRFQAWIDPSNAAESDWRAMISELFDEDPLAVIPVYSPRSELDIAGVLWVPERGSLYASTGIDIYVKRMFVANDAQVAVPTWARFLKGMVNSNKLKRIVSGNALKANIESRQVRDFLRDKIIDAFQEWRRLPDSDYGRIVNPHDDSIKGLATEDDEFRDCVWDKIRFSIRGRRVTLPDYQRMVKRRTRNEEEVIYFNDSPRRKFQADLISDATGIPILDLTQTRDQALVHRLAEVHSWPMQSEKELAAEHFDSPTDSVDWAQLIAACAESNIYAEVRDYDPQYLPAVLLAGDTEDDRRNQLLDGLREFGEERFARDLEKLFVKATAANWGSSFYLNARNPLIRDLADASYQTQMAVGRALYNVSVMSVMPEIKPDEQRKFFTSITDVLQALIQGPEAKAVTGGGQAEESSGVDTITVFAIMPYDAEYNVFELAIRKFFEGPPYFFRVVLARDRVLTPRLLDNVHQYIEIADAFAVELSSLNSNVLLELGGALFDGRARPIFAFRSPTSESTPVDISDMLHVDYTPSQDLDTLVTSIREVLERDGKPSHSGLTALLGKRAARTLTRTALELIRTRLKPAEINRLLSGFPTVEELIEAAPGDVERRTGIPSRHVSGIQDDLSEVIGQ